jgi:chromosome segregation ATPase
VNFGSFDAAVEADEPEPVVHRGVPDPAAIAAVAQAHIEVGVLRGELAALEKERAELEEKIKEETRKKEEADAGCEAAFLAFTAAVERWTAATRDVEAKEKEVEAAEATAKSLGQRVSAMFIVQRDYDAKMKELHAYLGGFQAKVNKSYRRSKYLAYPN